MATKKAKSKIDYSDPLYIGNELNAFDKKDYGFYDRLTDEQKKKFSTYLMLRWGATVEGSSDLAGFYNVAINEYCNMHFFELNKHKKLQWLLLCASSPGVGKQKHYWLGAAKKDNVHPIKKFMLEKFPTMKEQEIDLMIRINSKEDLLSWISSHGLEDKELKELTKLL